MEKVRSTGSNLAKVGRTSSRNQKHSEAQNVIIDIAQETNQGTTHNSVLENSTSPPTGMTTVISTNGSTSGGSGSTDVPHSTGNNSNAGDGKNSQIKGDYHSSPRKKVSQHVVMSSQALDNFQTLSSTKQNIELFKILTAIAVEIDGLQRSTEKRFSILETLVVKNQEQQDVSSPHNNRIGNGKPYQSNSSSRVNIVIWLL